MCHKHDFSLNIYSQILFYDTKYIFCFSDCLITVIVIITQKSSGINMSITAEVHEYFENLIKLLITDQSLGEFLCKFIEGIISKFEDKLREQNLKIQELESKIHLQENAFKKLEIISDDNEQYSHRSCLHIPSIQFKEGDGGDIMEEIEKCYNIMGIPFSIYRK